MALLKTAGRTLSAKLTRPPLERFLEKHATNRRTLDLGAQNGPYARLFPNRVGVDIRHGQGVSALTDAQALAFLSGSFEVVVCTEVLEHLPEPQRAINEMYRVLQPGGTLILTTRFLFPIHDAPHDYFRFTKYGLRHLLRKFEIVELAEETTSIGALAVLIQRLGMQAETLGQGWLRWSWLLAAQVVRRFPRLVTKEFGDSRRRIPEQGIITSGYHVACRKP